MHFSNIKKLKLTIDNLRDSDKSIRFYVRKNLEENSVHIKTKDSCILNDNFFVIEIEDYILKYPKKLVY